MSYEEYMIRAYIEQREPWKIDQAWEGMPRESCDAWPWKAWELSPEAEHFAWVQWELFTSAHRAIIHFLTSL